MKDCRCAKSFIDMVEASTAKMEAGGKTTPRQEVAENPGVGL